jgi:hypothetical protein
MRHPLELISPERRRPVFVLLLVLTLTVMVVLQVMGGPLKTGAAPQGIISYELAGDIPTVEMILGSWDPQTRIYAGFNLGLDYLFLVLYSATIACACAWIAGTLRSRSRPLATAGLLLAWGQWLAALLDSIENAALLVLLLGTPTAPWPPIAYWCAVIKFALVLLGLLYVLVGGVWAAVSARRG